MKTKTENRLLVVCIVLAVVTIVLTLTLIFFNPNKVVPNKGDPLIKVPEYTEKN